MQPSTQTQHGASPSERQTNYLILRQLEAQLDPARFDALLATVSGQLQLPQHLSWDGTLISSDYKSLKATLPADEAAAVLSLEQKLTLQNIAKLGDGATKTLSEAFKHFLEPADSQNLFGMLHCQLAKPQDIQRKVGGQSYQHLQHMKTVFCHANLQTDEVSSIYNAHFDKQGKFIVSAGDEGVIKVWDSQTLTLQASLQGHSDFITEVDISRCGRFIASSGKDSAVVVWHLQKGRVAYRFSHHKKLVNCVKFFSPPASDQLLLFTCGDDGAVRLYDFSQNHVQTKVIYGLQRSQSVKQAVSQDNLLDQGVYTVELNDEGLRLGRKKLDSLVINHAGVVAAGSCTGELLLWRINFDLLKRRADKKEYIKFLGQFKLDKQNTIKFSEFSPLNGLAGVGNVLMAGNVDGSVNLWNLAVGPWDQMNNFELDRSRLLLSIDEVRGCRKQKEIKATGPDGSVHSEFILEEVADYTQGFKYTKCVCDAVRWSINGRYALSAISIQTDANEDICKIKVWDSLLNQFNDDLTKASNTRLTKNTFVFCTHPFVEELLMTGSDGGLVSLWNINTHQLIRQFKQHGVFSVDAQIMDNPVHGCWAPDGRAFVTGNSLGTISLYAIEDQAHQYTSTRVQQFYNFEAIRATDNPFERLTSKPMLCGYNMAPYEVQPERYLIRFTTVDQNYSTDDFQRSLQTARQLGQIEERYYKDKLDTALNINQQSAQEESDDSQAPVFNPTLIHVPSQRAQEQRQAQVQESDSDTFEPAQIPVPVAVARAPSLRTEPPREIQRVTSTRREPPQELQRAPSQRPSNIERATSRTQPEAPQELQRTPSKRRSKLAIVKESFYLSDNELPPNQVEPLKKAEMLLVAQQYQHLKAEAKYSQVQKPPQPCSLCKRPEGETLSFQCKTQCLWVHRDCLETNTFSYLRDGKYYNVDTMVRLLQHFECFRCTRPGASASCSTCGKMFHGYHCAPLYLLPQASEPELKSQDRMVNKQYWQCLFCQDQLNNKNCLDLKSQMTTTYLSQLALIDRAWTLQDTQSQAYLPQIDDVVSYFWQGHEQFCFQYNCHFYAGQSSYPTFEHSMPFIGNETLRSQPALVCRVVSHKKMFPSMRSVQLMNLYGLSSSQTAQTPQIVMRVELQLISNNQVFFVDLWPSELPDFLALNTQRMTSKEGKLNKTNQKVKITSESALESIYPLSDWQTLTCSNKAQVTHSDLRPQTGVSFPESLQIKEYLSKFCRENKQRLQLFQQRVQARIAPDYQQIIPQEMWLDLIISRLQHDYYRSASEILNDLELVAINAKVYNTAAHPVAIDAREVVNTIKAEISKLLPSNYQERLIHQRVASKATEPFEESKEEGRKKRQRLN